MISATEKKTLKKFLALAPEPEDTFTYDELLGYMFGLAMTPEIILPSEWMPVIFGGETPICTSTEQAEKMNSCLIRIYNRFTADFQEHKLNFPFDIEKLKEHQVATLIDWVSGFEEAISLREELWDPEEYPELPDRKKEELYQSMITVLGLVDPMEIMDFFATLPDEVFQDAFVDLDPTDSDRTALIQAFLLASLPLAIETLQDHAYTLEKKRQQQFTTRNGQAQIQSTKVGRNEPCPCNSGKKFKNCCGSDGRKKIDPFSSASPQKSNIIKVDFPQHGKKRSTKTPIYQLKVGLQGAKPPIWRRIQVPGTTSLERLHFILQICMGWDDYHLHQFIIDRTCYCVTEEDDIFETSPSKDEAKYTLQKLEEKLFPSFQYIYDYGDDWLHKITVEKTLPHEEGKPYPVLITGRRACPPEDSGGIHNYMRLMEVLKNPEDVDFQETIDWIGMGFDPAEFDKEEMAMINVVLKELFS